MYYRSALIAFRTGSRKSDQATTPVEILVTCATLKAQKRKSAIESQQVIVRNHYFSFWNDEKLRMFSLSDPTEITSETLVDTQWSRNCAIVLFVDRLSKQSLQTCWSIHSYCAAVALFAPYVIFGGVPISGSSIQ